jgi:hypothetical protein
LNSNIAKIFYFTQTIGKTETVSLIADGIQLYKDQTAKSIGESIVKLADEISALPPGSSD